MVAYIPLYGPTNSLTTARFFQRMCALLFTLGHIDSGGRCLSSLLGMSGVPARYIQDATPCKRMTGDQSQRLLQLFSAAVVGQ
jgi:hypothetical protein